MTDWPWPIISAGLTVLVLGILGWVNFVRPAKTRNRAETKQKAVDGLSELLSTAIHDLLNRKPAVRSDADLKEWEADYEGWCTSVGSILGDHFTRSEQLHFDRVGTVPVQKFGMAYNAHHNHLLCQLDIKFDRLRDIIRDNQQRE